MICTVTSRTPLRYKRSTHDLISNITNLLPLPTETIVVYVVTLRTRFGYPQEALMVCAATPRIRFRYPQTALMVCAAKPRTTFDAKRKHSWFACSTSTLLLIPTKSTLGLRRNSWNPFRYPQKEFMVCRSLFLLRTISLSLPRAYTKTKKI